jgi:hypothetical protein
MLTPTCRQKKSNSTLSKVYKMKKLIYTLIVGLILSIPALAQPKRNIESIRAAFITQRLDLTPEESQRFWPVYNAYHHELQQLLTKRNQQRKAFKQDGTAFDDLQIEGEILTLKKKYRREFEKVLPQRKAAQIYPAEREFRQHLLEELKERKRKN